MVNCNISKLGRRTFRAMPLLDELNLAWNNFEVLERNIFQDVFVENL